MFQNILVPTDGSALSQDAVQYGITLAKAANAKITVMTVSTPFETIAIDPDLFASPEQYRSRTKTLAGNYLAVANDMAAAAGVSCHTIHIEHDHPYQAIIDTAVQQNCDLIVMASHGRRGISAIVLGSETLKVLTHSTIPVLVLRAPRQSMFFVAS